MGVMLSGIFRKQLLRSTAQLAPRKPCNSLGKIDFKVVMKKIGELS